jgi:hypothetical protein
LDREVRPPLVESRKTEKGSESQNPSLCPEQGTMSMRNCLPLSGDRCSKGRPQSTGAVVFAHARTGGLFVGAQDDEFWAFFSAAVDPPATIR